MGFAPEEALHGTSFCKAAAPPPISAISIPINSWKKEKKKLFSIAELKFVAIKMKMNSEEEE